MIFLLLLCIKVHCLLIFFCSRVYVFELVMRKQCIQPIKGSMLVWYALYFLDFIVLAGLDNWFLIAEGRTLFVFSMVLLPPGSLSE